MMDFSRARDLCTERELVLVAASRATEMERLTRARLQANVVRSRKLRDKFRDLARRQRRESLGKAAPRRARPASGNARTLEKAALFDEVLKRFQSRLAELDREDATTVVLVRKRVPAGKRRTSRGSASAARARRRSVEASLQGAGKQAKLSRSHAPRAKAHARARNRRNQARRDAR